MTGARGGRSLAEAGRGNLVFATSGIVRGLLVYCDSQEPQQLGNIRGRDIRDQTTIKESLASSCTKITPLGRIYVQRRLPLPA